jgi:hypothetical protein
MPEPRPRSWHLQPDIASLAPESFTAQKLVGVRGLCNILGADRHSNMLRQSTFTSHRGASSSGPSLYASLHAIEAPHLHMSEDSMAE